MRYTIKDLFLTTALLAINLAALKLASRPFRPEEANGIALGLLLLAIVFWAGFFPISYAMRNQALREHEPFIAVISVPFPWRMYFFITGLCLVASIMIEFHTGLFGLFLGLSILLWLRISFTLLCPAFHISSEGVLFQNWFVQWKDIYPVRQADGLLTHIRVSNPYLGHKLAVPEEYREQVDALIPKRMHA